MNEKGMEVNAKAVSAYSCFIASYFTSALWARFEQYDILSFITTIRSKYGQKERRLNDIMMQRGLEGQLKVDWALNDMFDYRSLNFKVHDKDHNQVGTKNNYIEKSRVGSGISVRIQQTEL